MMAPRWPLLLLAASGWLTLWVTTEAAPGGPLRVIVSVLFLLVCPGASIMALVRPLLGRRDHSGDAMETVALTLAISIGLGMLVSELYFMTGTFEMESTLSVLAGITTTASLGALGASMRRRRRRYRALGLTAAFPTVPPAAETAGSTSDAPASAGAPARNAAPAAARTSGSSARTSDDAAAPAEPHTAPMPAVSAEEPVPAPPKKPQTAETTEKEDRKPARATGDPASSGKPAEPTEPRIAPLPADDDSPDSLTMPLPAVSADAAAPQQETRQEKKDTRPDS